MSARRQSEAPAQPSPLTSAGRYARLRGLGDRYADLAQAGTPAHEVRLIGALACDFERLAASQGAQLKQLVAAGAVLYLRGPFAGRTYSLAPLTDLCFSLDGEVTALGYRFKHDELMPAVLMGESIECSRKLPHASGFSSAVRPLLVAFAPQSGEWPLVFAQAVGQGVVICDLQAEERSAATSERPILQRLSEPHSRCADSGALIAARRASHAAPRPPAYDLVLDDRPRSFEYGREAVLRAWLTHMSGLCPDMHVDFAWTPSQYHPSRAYVQTLKAFRAGFVWHGFHQHVDHRRLSRPEAALARGRRLVESICRRFGVRFQPVMIFPYERTTPETIRSLKRAGFIASAESLDNGGAEEAHLPPFLRYSTPFQTLYAGLFPVLRRHALATLSYDRMLALGALDLPIIAAAHPGDFGLRHLSRLRDRGAKERFDKVLMFAASKGLRPRSLEEIALELLGELAAGQ